LTGESYVLPISLRSSPKSLPRLPLAPAAVASGLRNAGECNKGFFAVADAADAGGGAGGGGGATAAVAREMGAGTSCRHPIDIVESDG